MSDRVLVVDDDTWMAAHYARALAKAGFEPVVAANALEAMEQLDVAVPEVIILDMLMPGPNGMVFLHEIQSHADLAQIPIIVATNTDTVSLAALKPYGVKEVLSKSTMQPDDIIRAVRRVL